MSNTEVEKRISVLERELNRLKTKIEKIEKKDKPWWEQIAGTFADNPAYDEAMRLGREYRLAQREDYDKED
ncbi:MAG: hypothetical protein ACR2MG_10650 [Pyrinomonadaceae bacterium]